MLQIPRSALCAVLLWPLGAAAANTNDALTKATAALAAAVPRAAADTTRPVFHVTSPAQWMNDPNGPIFYQGSYHLFYQLYPFNDAGGPKYWGHVRSRDLVKWEHLPIALWPATEAGEAEVWSGCCTLNGRGQPMIFYTSIAPGQSALTHAEQWAATSADKDLIHWQKSSANPVLSEALHGDRKIYDWRDPFIFHLKKRTFMVLGGSLNQSKGGQATVNIYEAGNPELTKWKYRGVLFQHPDAGARTAECPNFFQLGNKWVLLVSPYGKVQYFVGDFNAETCRFTTQARGLLDAADNFYAPNTMQIADGRRLVWGWVRGFPNGRGWNGCLTLPRELSWTPNGDLKQEPAPQLSKLRGKRVEWRNLQWDNGSRILELPRTNTLEILADVEMKAGSRIEFQFKRGTNDPSPAVISFNGSELQVLDSKAPLKLPAGEKRLSLRIFFDRSVLEVFAAGTVCATKIITPLDASPLLEIRGESGLVEIKRLQVWPMKTIW